MRSDTLVFLHILAAAALFGSLLAVAMLAGRGHTIARLRFRSSLLALAAAFATVAVGEAAGAREDAEGTWLDVASVLGYGGLLLPSTVLVAMTGRQRDGRWATALASAMSMVALAAAFVMAAKPS